MNWQDFSKVGSRLRKMIFDPVFEVTESISHIFLAPDGELAHVSFATLPLDESANRCIVDLDCTLSYLTFARDIMRHADFSRLKNHGSEALVMVSPSFGTQILAASTEQVDRSCSAEDLRAQTFEDLPGTAHEGECIARLLRQVRPAIHVRMLHGENATTTELLGVRSPWIVHIATHGFFLEGSFQSACCPAKRKKEGHLEKTLGSWRNPFLRAGLAFAGARAWLEAQPGSGSQVAPGILTALDIRDIDLHGTCLATVSACDSGLGDVPRGEGIASMGSAFSAAGAHSVLMSLWRISDSVTADLMTKFYEQILSKTVGRARALKDLSCSGFPSQSGTNVASVNSMGLTPKKSASVVTSAGSWCTNRVSSRCKGST